MFHCYAVLWSHPLVHTLRTCEVRIPPLWRQNAMEIPFPAVWFYKDTRTHLVVGRILIYIVYIYIYTVYIYVIIYPNDPYFGTLQTEYGEVCKIEHPLRIQVCPKKRDCLYIPILFGWDWVPRKILFDLEGSTGFLGIHRVPNSLLECPRKLGSMLRKWALTPIYPHFLSRWNNPFC